MTRPVRAHRHRSGRPARVGGFAEYLVGTKNNPRRLVRAEREGVASGFAAERPPERTAPELQALPNMPSNGRAAAARPDRRPAPRAHGASSSATPSPTSASQGTKPTTATETSACFSPAMTSSSPRSAAISWRPCTTASSSADYFKSEMSEYDTNYVFVPLDILQHLRTMGDRVTSIQIKLKDYR